MYSKLKDKEERSRTHIEILKIYMNWIYPFLKNHFGEDVCLQNCWITLELLTMKEVTSLNTMCFYQSQWWPVNSQSKYLSWLKQSISLSF